MFDSGYSDVMKQRVSVSSEKVRGQRITEETYKHSTYILELIKGPDMQINNTNCKDFNTRIKCILIIK